MLYAVIRIGGKQYKVSEGDIVSLEHLEAGVGETVEFSEVLLIAGKGKLSIGRPKVKGAKVVGEVVEQGKEKKIRVFKYKKRKGSKRMAGHRQLVTKVRIKEIKGVK